MYTLHLSLFPFCSTAKYDTPLSDSSHPKFLPPFCVWFLISFWGCLSLEYISEDLHSSSRVSKFPKLSCVLQSIHFCCCGKRKKFWWGWIMGKSWQEREEGGRERCRETCFGGIKSLCIFVFHK